MIIFLRSGTYFDATNSPPQQKAAELAHQHVPDLALFYQAMKSQ